MHASSCKSVTAPGAAEVEAGAASGMVLAVGRDGFGAGGENSGWGEGEGGGGGDGEGGGGGDGEGGGGGDGEGGGGRLCLGELAGGGPEAARAASDKELVEAAVCPSVARAGAAGWGELGGFGRCRALASAITNKTTISVVEKTCQKLVRAGIHARVQHLST